MTLNLATKYRAQSGQTEFTPEFWNSFIADVAIVLNSIQGKSVAFDTARAELIQAALFRVNEILLPAFERVFDYQEAGFLNAPIATDSEVTFAEGFTTVVIHPDNRDLFRPTPYVALIRSSTHADVAIARSDGYDPENGALSLEIVAVIGDNAGPHSDIIVSATAGTVQAQQHFLGLTKAAQDLAKDWAEKAIGQDVDGVGTRSAKHHANAAAGSASAAAGAAETATGAATTATGAATIAGQHRDKSAEWAAKDGDEEVADGLFSARHYALKALAAAAEAATFDPSSYYTKPEVATALGGKQSTSEKGQANGYASLDGDGKVPSEQMPPLGEMSGLARATASQIRALSGDAGITPTRAADALAAITPSGASNWTPDWTSFYAAEWTVTANRQINNPTNVIPKTTRTARIAANSGTTRTISFGSNFKGDLPTVQVTSSSFVTLFLYAESATSILVSDKPWN